jgi:hypothetical protein
MSTANREPRYKATTTRTSRFAEKKAPNRRPLAAAAALVSGLCAFAFLRAGPAESPPLTPDTERAEETTRELVDDRLQDHLRRLAP